MATGDWNVTSETSQFDFLFLTLCGVCPSLVDTMGLRYHGTMRRTVRYCDMLCSSRVCLCSRPCGV